MVRDRLRHLKVKAIEETKNLFWIFLYLWMLLSLFSFHKALVLKEEYLIYDQGFALINALVLAKVILIGEFFHIGENLKNRPLIYPILFKSAVFAVLLICFHIIEQSLRGVFLEGKTLSQSIPSIGSGGLQAILLLGIIIFVVLMPFFAFRELYAAIGAIEFRTLLFGDEPKARAVLPASMRTGWRLAEAGALAVALAGGWLIWSLHRDTAADSATQKLEGGSVARNEAASAAAAAPTVLVGARVSGVVQALECDLNMKVKAGQLCAKIDARPYQSVVDKNKSDLAEGEARLERDKADLAQARAALEHREARAKRGAISRKAVDKSRKAYEEAQARMKVDQADVAQLQTALNAAETNLGYTDIVAPEDGTIVSRNVEIGQTVASDPEAPPLFVIATDRSTDK
jgi:biotin carboxyl carrier protein